MKTAEQLAKYVANAKAKRHARALTEGRVPGQIGTPKRLDEEQKSISLAKKRKRDTKNSLRIRTEKRAAKAIAEGRIPGKSGQPRQLSDIARIEHKKENSRRFRAQHIARRREYERKWKEKLRSTPEGRKYLQDIAVVPGAKRRAQKRGCEGSYTKEDIRALFFEQKGLCGLCDMALDETKFHVDHWKPLSKGAKLPSELNLIRSV